MKPSYLRPGLALGLCLTVFSGCYSAQAYKKAENMAKGLDRILKERREYTRSLALENKRLEAENASYRRNAKDAGEVEELRKELEALIAKWQESGALAGKNGMTIVRDSAGNTGLRIPGEILFASGSAQVTDSGKKVLLSILSSLEKAPRIRIDGHTDDDPIKNSSWKSNLHLSVSRALAVSDVLVTGKMSRDRIAVQGMGPSQPITADSRDKNRRVEIFLLQRAAAEK